MLCPMLKQATFIHYFVELITVASCSYFLNPLGFDGLQSYTPLSSGVFNGSPDFPSLSFKNCFFLIFNRSSWRKEDRKLV